jgi:signal transduction histidine kinase
LEIGENLQNNSKNLFVLADKDKLKQVLVNLVDNAIKFTTPGGRIVAESFLKGGMVNVEVVDSGVGIPANILPRVFEKFQQGSNIYIKENKGAGLGLFIVKSLIELHKGKISVESQVGKGTKFAFTLPAVAAK